MLPIEPVLPQLLASLDKTPFAVMVAPPGAGKTTRVPLALLEADWAREGRIILLEPRRLAARAAAARMAAMLGERVGDTVGLRVRFQTEVSARTRIEVVTEGVFTRMVLSDPGLEGVCAVIFDEFHERSLDADLGLAFALDAHKWLRDDLRLVVMSATLDGAAVARLLDDAPVIQSEGRSFSVDTRHVARDQAQRLEDQVVRVIQRALANDTGSLLVFLPGQGEIRRVEERLAALQLPDDVLVAPLFGALSLLEQDRAVQPSLEGLRKIVLATSIAETSLTIEGVRVVIDSGLARVPQYSPATGLTQLATVRVSRASADQRRGRAGRTEPGVCYRLWNAEETRALPAFATPEIRECDLAGLALSLAEWGAKSPADLALLDSPPAGAFAEARSVLQRLAALNSAGDLTDHGRRLAALPLPPRLADRVVRGALCGQGQEAAQLAALLTERGLGGSSTDIIDRLRRFQSDRSPRAREVMAMADRWARTAGRAEPGGARLSPALLIAHAFPERIAQRRDGDKGDFRLASGRGARLEPTDALARSEWLAVAELGGGGQGGDRIRLAASLDPAALQQAFADQIETRQVIETDALGRVRVKTQKRIGELILSEQRIERPDRRMVAQALLSRVRDEGMASLAWNDASLALRARIAFAQTHFPEDSWPDLTDPVLAASAQDWLTPLLEQAGSLAAVKSEGLHEALKAMVPWTLQRRLDEVAPSRLETPAGTSHPIDYTADGGPKAEVRVQALFGLKSHPMIANGRLPLTLALTSPAHRPIQVTRDLPGYWAGSWRDVKSEMKGRYPRHPWPDDPASAPPTTRAKPRGT